MDPTNNPTPTTPSPIPAGSAPTPNPTPAPGANPMTSSGFEDATASGPTPVPGANSPVVPANPTGQPNVVSTNPVVRPSGLGVTDPIMMPEKPQEPDPVEEELKAPMKAADPVPGSIGSAVSGPAEGAAPVAPAENPFANSDVKPTPSVAFTDPAAQAEANPNPETATAKPAKKTNKATLIALIAVAAVIVVVLVVILIMQLTAGNKGNSSSSNSSNTNSQAVVEEEEETETETEAEAEAEAGANLSDYDTVIVCKSSSTDTQGNSIDTERTYGIVNNKLLEVISDTKTTGQDGTLVGSSSETMAVESVLKNTTTDMSKSIDTDGTLLVTEEVLKGQLETMLNSDGTSTFACIVSNT